MGETIWYLIALLLGMGIVAWAAYEAGQWNEREKWHARQAAAIYAHLDEASRSRHPSGRDQ